MIYSYSHLNRCAGVAQSVEQLIRNQQVMCSSHTTSSKKHRKLRFSMLFLLQKLCACEKVYADTHDNNKIYERDDGSNKQVSA